MMSKNNDPQDESIEEPEPDAVTGSVSASDPEHEVIEGETLEGPHDSPEGVSNDSPEATESEDLGESLDSKSAEDDANVDSTATVVDGDEETHDYESSVADDDGMTTVDSDESKKPEVAEDDSADEDEDASTDSETSDEQSVSAESQLNQTAPKDSSRTPKSDDEPQFRGALLTGWGVAAVALLAIAGYGIYSGTQTTVPQAAVSYSSDEKDATDKTCQDFADADLKCEIFVKDSYDVPGGGFIEQSADAGSKIKKDSTIKIVYSSGPQFGEMPDVSGLPIDTASTELSKEGIEIAGTKKVDNSGIPAGHIVGSSIKPGSVTDNGQEIRLTISSGVTTAPDFKDMSADQAIKEASDAGLEAKIDWVEGPAPYGVVKGQSIEEGTEIKDGMITVEVSRPFDGAALQIPQVEGMPQDKALSMFYDSGITMLNIVEVDGDTDEILSVSPSGSQYVSASQVVTVVVSTTEDD